MIGRGANYDVRGWWAHYTPTRVFPVWGTAPCAVVKSFSSPVFVWRAIQIP